MAVNTDIATISQNPALNGPDGGVDPPSALDDSIRNALSFVAKLRDGVGYTAGAVPVALGYTPIQQGTGPGQQGNAVKIGWSTASQLRLTVDSTDFASIWPISITGRASVATNADNATRSNTTGYADSAGTASNASQLGGLGPSGFVKNEGGATTIGMTWDGNQIVPNVNGTPVFMRTTWSSVVNRPTALSAFANDIGYVARGDDRAYTMAYETNRVVIRVNSGAQPAYTIWTAIDGRPTGLSAFTNDGNFAQRYGNSMLDVGAPDNSGTIGRALPNTDNRIRNITVQAGGLGVIADNTGYTWAIQASDARLKKNIKPTTEDSVAKIGKMQFRSFEFTDVAPMFKGIKRKSGLIAQEAEKVDPDWITNGGDYKQLNMETLLTTALHAIQQLSAKITDLEERLAR
jgi:hypothetical protein